MVKRWQPLADARTEMGRLHDEMNRLFGRFGDGVREFARTVYPPLDLWEDDANLYVEAELAGHSLNDLEIHVTGENQLTIKGERKVPELGNGSWHRQERGYGSFHRLMELPSAVDSDKVSADFKNGVLTITLPKKEEARPRRIDVKGS